MSLSLFNIFFPNELLNKLPHPLTSFDTSPTHPLWVICHMFTSPLYPIHPSIHATTTTPLLERLHLSTPHHQDCHLYLCFVFNSILKAMAKWSMLVRFTDDTTALMPSDLILRKLNAPQTSSSIKYVYGALKKTSIREQFVYVFWFDPERWAIWVSVY